MQAMVCGFVMGGGLALPACGAKFDGSQSTDAEPVLFGHCLKPRRVVSNSRQTMSDGTGAMK